MTTPHPDPRDLAPSARRLLAILIQMTDDERAVATNRHLAARIGTSTAYPRTVSEALAALTAAGLIHVTRTKPDPRLHPTGRKLTVTDAARQQEDVR